jgi:hypothetical protein
MKKRILILLSLFSILSCHKETKQEELERWKNRLRKYEANHKNPNIVVSSRLILPLDSTHITTSKQK